MKKICTFLALACLSEFIYAQDGTLDSGFAKNGLSVIKNAGNHGDLPANMFITKDGKNVQVGSATTDSSTSYLLIRRKQDGTPDGHFGNNGVALANIAGKDGNASATVELSNGNYMLTGNSLKGNFSKYNLALMQFDKHGNIDSSFATNGHVVISIGDGNDNPSALLLQPDGKLVVTGDTYYLGQPVFFAARFLPGGELDTTFGIKGKSFVLFKTTSLFCENGALQDDGKIVILGSIQNADYEYDYALTRLNADGSIDKNFGNNGRVVTDFGGNNDFAYGISFQSNKKIIVAGYYNAGNYANTGIIRYNVDGTPDITFGHLGKAFATISTANLNCFSVAIQPDNKIVAGCTANYFTGGKADYALVRFNANGKIDSSFGANGITTTAVTNGYDEITTIKIADGKILAAGSSQNKTGISKLSEVRYLISQQQTMVNVENATSNGLSVANSIKVYPNPAQDYLIIKADWQTNQPVNITIYNANGKVVFNQKYVIINKNDEVKININKTWNQGKYFIKVEGNISLTTSFMIVK